MAHSTVISYSGLELYKTLQDTKNNKTYVKQEADKSLLSATDKVKLDGIDDGANKYILPKANSSALGGIKIGNNIDIDTDGVVSVATTSNSDYGVVKVGSNISVSNGIISLSSSNVVNALGFTPTAAEQNVATTTSDGLMSSSDKVKVNSLFHQTNTAYTVGERVSVAEIPSYYYLECATAGTTSVTAPDFSSL